MSRNLVELVRRHHEVGAPTALEVLEAMEQRGEITDDDRRAAAAPSELPEAPCTASRRSMTTCWRRAAPGSETSDEFPLVLVTGRRLEHYNAGTMTRRTGNLGEPHAGDRRGPVSA